MTLAVVPEVAPDGAWRAWAASLVTTPPEARCAECLRLRLDATAAAAAAAGARRFSTTLSVSPYQRHDLIRAGGEAAAAAHGVEFVYLDVRSRFRDSYAESRRLGLYRQSYCGCAASKWEAWAERRGRDARAGRRGRTSVAGMTLADLEYELPHGARRAAPARAARRLAAARRAA